MQIGSTRLILFKGILGQLVQDLRLVAQSQTLLVKIIYINYAIMVVIVT